MESCSPNSPPPRPLQRKSRTRGVAYDQSVLDSATDLLKIRLTSLVRHAVESEFSSELPLILRPSEALPFAIAPRSLHVAAEGLLIAARERVAHLVAQAIAERLARGEGSKWLDSNRALERRAQREFDAYIREEHEQAGRRERLAKLRGQSGRGLKDSRSKAALRMRLAALQLRGVQ
jgi:hypothetical protein